MAGNETEINLRFKVNDDGSIVLDKIGKSLGGIEGSAKSAGSALQMIKFDSIINLGERAFNTAKQLYAFVEAGAKVRSIEDSFVLMAKNSGVAIGDLIARLRTATNDTIDSSALMEKATRLIGEGFSADSITTIAEASRTAARLMGTDVKTAYDSISESIVNLREKGLKSAGFVIDLDAAYAKHAATLGVTKDELNNYGKQMALVNAVKEKNLELTEKLGIAQETEYEKLQKLNAQYDDFKEGIGELALEGWKELQSYIGSTYSGIKSLFGLLDSLKGKSTYPTEEEHGQAGRAAALAGLNEVKKSQTDSFNWNSLIITQATKTKVIHEVDLQLLKDQESTLKRMVDLQSQLNKSGNEAIDIANRLGIGTKAALTQWIETDMVGEYEKLLGSGLFSGEEMEQFKERYTDALKGALEGGWGAESKQLEEAMKRIQNMKVEDTGLEKIRVEFEKLQKSAKYLEKFTGSIKMEDDELVRAAGRVKELLSELQKLTSTDWKAVISMTGHGSSELPITEKIKEVADLFEWLGQKGKNLKLQVSIPTQIFNVKDMMAEVSSAFQSMGPVVGNMVMGLQQKDLDNAIAGYKADIMTAYSPHTGRQYSAGYWEKMDQGIIANAQAQIEKLQGFQTMLSATGSYAAGQAAPSPSGGEGGYGGGGGDVIVNIGTIYVNGENAQAVAAELDAQLADLYLRDRSKLKNAIEGSA